MLASAILDTLSRSWCMIGEPKNMGHLFGGVQRVIAKGRLESLRLNFSQQFLFRQSRDRRKSVDYVYTSRHR